jgi:hypothetical protein
MGLPLWYSIRQYTGGGGAYRHALYGALAQACTTDRRLQDCPEHGGYMLTLSGSLLIGALLPACCLPLDGRQPEPLARPARARRQQWLT